MQTAKRPSPKSKFLTGTVYDAEMENEACSPFDYTVKVERKHDVTYDTIGNIRFFRGDGDLPGFAQKVQSYDKETLLHPRLTAEGELSYTNSDGELYEMRPRHEEMRSLANSSKWPSSNSLVDGSCSYIEGNSNTARRYRCTSILKRLWRSVSRTFGCGAFLPPSQSYEEFSTRSSIYSDSHHSSSLNWVSFNSSDDELRVTPASSLVLLHPRRVPQRPQPQKSSQLNFTGRNRCSFRRIRTKPEVVTSSSSSSNSIKVLFSEDREYSIVVFGDEVPSQPVISCFASSHEFVQESSLGENERSSATEVVVAGQNRTHVKRRRLKKYDHLKGGRSFRELNEASRSEGGAELETSESEAVFSCPIKEGYCDPSKVSEMATFIRSKSSNGCILTKEFMEYYNINKKEFNGREILNLTKDDARKQPSVSHEGQAITAGESVRDHCENNVPIPAPRKAMSLVEIARSSAVVKTTLKDSSQCETCGRAFD